MMPASTSAPAPKRALVWGLVCGLTLTPPNQSVLIPTAHCRLLTARCVRASDCHTARWCVQTPQQPSPQPPTLPAGPPPSPPPPPLPPSAMAAATIAAAIAVATIAAVAIAAATIAAATIAAPQPTTLRVETGRKPRIALAYR